MKIKTKLLLLAALISVVLIGLTGIMYLRISNVTTEIANGDALATAQDQAKMIDLYITGLVNVGDNAAPGVAALIGPSGMYDRQEIVSMMADLRTANLDNNITDVYIGFDSDGVMISGNGYEPPEGFDARERPWYVGAVEKRGTDVSEPYLDDETGGVVISVSTPVYGEHGKLIGVLAADVDIKTLVSNIAEAKVLGVNGGILLAPDGTVLEHPNKDFIMKENFAKQSDVISERLVEIGRRMISGGSGMEDFTAGGSRMRVFYATSKFGFVAAIVCPVSRISEVVRQITDVQMITGAIALVVVLAWLGFMIPSISRPLRGVERTLAKIASFDLTVDEQEARLEASADPHTEIGAMLRSLTAMRDAWSGVVSSVRGEVDRASSAAGTLDELADRATGIVNDTKIAIDNVNGGAQTALKSLQTTTATIGDVSQAASRNSDSAADAASAAGEMSELSESVSKIMTDFVAELGSVGTEVMQNSESMNVVGTSVQSITEFVGTIESIASQTNLLALNAAIEAARAGEAGRGFAVVAEEVRHLAEESNEASHSVAKLIEDLASNTTNAIDSTRRSAGIITEIMEKARGAHESLEAMIEHIGKLTTNVRSIAAAAQEQTAASIDVADSAASVRRSVESVVSEISDIASSTGGTVSAMREVADEAVAVSEIAHALNETMKSFKTSDSPDPSRPALAPKN